MTALATHVTGLPVIPAVLERVASLERVSLRPESLLPCAEGVAERSGWPGLRLREGVDAVVRRE
jgi:hypothetical protein